MLWPQALAALEAVSTQATWPFSADVLPLGPVGLGFFFFFSFGDRVSL